MVEVETIPCMFCGQESIYARERCMKLNISSPSHYCKQDSGKSAISTLRCNQDPWCSTAFSSSPQNRRHGEKSCPCDLDTYHQATLHKWNTKNTQATDQKLCFIRFIYIEIPSNLGQYPSVGDLNKCPPPLKFRPRHSYIKTLFKKFVVLRFPVSKPIGEKPQTSDQSIWNSINCQRKNRSRLEGLGVDSTLSKPSCW